MMFLFFVIGIGEFRQDAEEGRKCVPIFVPMGVFFRVKTGVVLP